ncbi:MAG: ASCH domain-containing protein [Candidatus Harrisonbacteria bacterium]|nr:ASCH domain-containing protein [Candidatus Harrisonbacteria bacterium]
MEYKKIKLKFREVDRDIFEAVKSGRKTVETRAATERYKNIKVGDTLILICGKNKLEKKIKRVKVFKTITALLKKYKAKQINPNVRSGEELEKMYYTFPDYKEKIRKSGLIAMELK